MSTTNPLAVPRSTAARMLGVSPATLRAWAASSPPRGPRPTKTGSSRQARALYRVADLDDWLSDPSGHERRRHAN